MIFVDTGAFLARFIERDQYHQAAVRHWQKLRANRQRYQTSNFVLDETFTLLGRRASYHFAAERARNLYASQLLLVLRPDSSDELAAIELFQKYSDQKVSFTDCISFVLMTKQKIKNAFSFDRHFEMAGFVIEPR